jgi:uncharacterized membrane protein
MADGLIYAVGEAIGLLLNAVLRVFGFTEVKAEKIVNTIVSLLAATFFLGLLYITFKYS